MKSISKANSQIGLFVAILTCVILMGSLTAYAGDTPVLTTEVARVLSIQTITAQCCVPFGPTVRVTEPATHVPVVITWSTDYAVSDTVLFGLSLNGGTCFFPGSGVANITFAGTQSVFVSGAFQWVVLPSDGLKTGVNTFTVCGGGVGKSATMVIGSNTLAARISN